MQTTIKCSECGEILSYPVRFKLKNMLYEKEYYFDWDNKRILCKECYKKLIK